MRLHMKITFKFLTVILDQPLLFNLTTNPKPYLSQI